MEERNRNMDITFCPYCHFIYNEYTCQHYDSNNELYSDDETIQGTAGLQPGASDMGRITLPQRKPQEGSESGGGATAEITIRTILKWDAILESSDRTFQHVGYGSTGQVEFGELWYEILRGIQLSRRAATGSNEPRRVKVTVEIGDDPTAEERRAGGITLPTKGSSTGGHQDGGVQRSFDWD